MNKKLSITLCIILLGFISSCGGRKINSCPEKSCQARYVYDECDASYELEVDSAEVHHDATCADNAELSTINKF